jgi:uncharacterized protein (TIGR03000 family)
VAGPSGAPPAREQAPAPKRSGGDKPDGGEAMAPSAATIVVSLPTDAKLFVDGVPTKSVSANRVFVSPALEKGMEYSYTLKAEVVRDGQPVTMSKKVAVEAGKTINVSLDVPVASLAQR